MAWRIMIIDNDQSISNALKDRLEGLGGRVRSHGCHYTAPIDLSGREQPILATSNWERRHVSDSTDRNHFL
jgi:hypothetical protein